MLQLFSDWSRSHIQCSIGDGGQIMVRDRDKFVAYGPHLRMAIRVESAWPKEVP